ncbi:MULTISPECIES: mannitol dehydrogenase family protein [unclassified Ruegeria]|uniref:mannitol dehydrogenase family protein n=1 Tax=unclassified Ruegeria TaxID=2625375 RepID=UPI0014910292|nr:MULTISPECIES: mannitol dehydrogenase family protein [unclassified Ruegeria]NOD47183.1 mannitol dehydrogenase family protein [Ruegeria sp. HKCCD5849]NOD51506.1 mannitol dehydrogenase family protein [Ruegeria sp. HKCCD5851]NOD69349.1 mannitol dehydrogenase family protein [Ruegeria sp. HKCCD7303]
MDPVANAKTPVRLRRDRLEDLPVTVRTPAYAPSDLTPGIVHIGLGNFHRAHQAWYIHQLMQQGQARDWAIIGAGVRSYDAEMRSKLLEQDCLTTLIELNPNGVSAEVIGPMIDYLPIETGNTALTVKMADPSIRIVSLTVTEGGYYLDANTGAFDTHHEDIRHDAANPNQPRTVFGAMVAALRQRRVKGITPFTALSCDNLQGNGTILRNCVVGLARMSDPDLADWIDQNGAFPNSMVDSIVPATTEQVVSQCRALGIDDRAPVSHENFRQWVIEDDFCAGRPPLEQVGVTLTHNVHSYETMKLRILNGGHQLLANVGEILNVPTISDCMQDSDILAFFGKVQSEEILPHVDAVPGTTAKEYLELVETRFANTAIHDTTRRVAFDGSARHPGFLLPSLRDALASGSSVNGLALAEAFWCRMCAGVREDGSEIVPNDPQWQNLQKTALASRSDPECWLQQAQYYGEIGRNTRFADAFTSTVSEIWQNGSRAVLSEYVAETSIP